MRWIEARLLTAPLYRASTRSTTPSPKNMRSRTILLYGIRRVVIGWNCTFFEAPRNCCARAECWWKLSMILAGAALLRAPYCARLELWSQDIGLKAAVA